MTIRESYYQRILDSKNPAAIRKQILEAYNASRNISLVARAFKTTRKTVRKIIQRFRAEGEEGLKDRCRRPHRMPRAIPASLEAKIVALREFSRRTSVGVRTKLWLGQQRIKWFLEKEGISISISTINRVLHKYNLIKPRLKKWQKRRMITAYRKTLKPLTLWQVDVKYLRDVPNLYGLILDGVIPAYQYTARDVVTGTTFFAYAEEFSMINSMRFIWLLLSHLEFFGVDVSEVVIQTDNGSEFIGMVYARRDSGFTELVERVFNGVHRTIPVATPRFNGAVESFHNRIEVEFYDFEGFSGRGDFLGKAYTFSLWFNLERPNMAFRETPWVRVRRLCGIDNPNFMNFPPLVLDDLKIDALGLLTTKEQLLEEYGKLMPFVYRRYTKGGLNGYHVSDQLNLYKKYNGEMVFTGLKRALMKIQISTPVSLVFRHFAN